MSVQLKAFSYMLANLKGLQLVCSTECSQEDGRAVVSGLDRCSFNGVDHSRRW